GKSDGILCKGPEVKYAFVECHRHLWPICVQCRVLRVSVSGFHQHRARRRKIASRRHLSDAALLAHISAAYAEHRGAYGWPRIWRELLRRGVRVGKQRVQRLMQQHGIQARGKRRFRVMTTDSRHDLPVAPNLLNRNFSPAAPNQAWTGDITYIATEEGWLFLAMVIDVLSRKGNCWDNAVTETLFGSLKVERLHGERFVTMRQAKDAVLGWLLWYNRQRMHSTLNYLSPTEFEDRWQNTASQAAA